MKAPQIENKKKKRARPGRGSLLLIATFLITSASLRIGTEAGQAFAKATAPDDMHGDMAADPLSCEPPADLRAMMEVFKAREDALVEREQALRARMQALSVTDIEVKRQLENLVSAEERLRGTIALADTAAEGDLARLTEVYESMKSKDAAALFEQMDPDFAAGFLGRMRPEAAAGVMAGLSPQAAYTISVVLAGRNATVPTE
jgi:flagellar motility protein MotE (MotC chaperone)